MAPRRARPGTKGYRHPLDLGFSEFVGFTDAVHAWEHFPKELWHGREKKPATGYAATIFADRAIDFMKRHKAEPFFLYVPFIEPHLRIEAPPEDVAEHKGKFAEKDPKKPLNATYAAMITRLDKEVGRILKALDDLKLARRHARRLHQRPRRDVRGRQRGDGGLPRLQRPLPRAEAHALRGRHARPRRRALARPGARRQDVPRRSST